jgi:hypothetical protein
MKALKRKLLAAIAVQLLRICRATCNQAYITITVVARILIAALLARIAAT